MSRDARTIKETREAITAIVLAFDAWAKINKDGNRTIAELLSLFSLTPAAWAALKDSSQILAEWKDLDGVEADELIAYVASQFNDEIDTPQMRVKIDKILIAFQTLADAIAQWFDINPPQPEIIS